MSSSLLELRRRDQDKLVLKKTISYTHFTETLDLSYGSATRAETVVSIYASLTIVIITDDWVGTGVLQAGDMTGTFRYQYSEETDGTAITPVIVPTDRDKITYAGEDYVIESLEPILLAEADGIVGYNFRAKTTK